MKVTTSVDQVSGRVIELVGLLIRATVAGVRVGEVCLIRSPYQARGLKAEVVGFHHSFDCGAR